MPYNKLRPTDEFLVNRGTNSYKTTVESLRTDSPVLKDNDQFLVQRGVNSYRISKEDLQDEIGAGATAPPVVQAAVLEQDDENAYRFTSNSFTTAVVATESPTNLRMRAEVVGALAIEAGSYPIVTNDYDGSGGIPLILSGDSSADFSQGDVVQASASYTPVSSTITDVSNLEVTATDNLDRNWTPYILNPDYADIGPQGASYFMSVLFVSAQTIQGNIRQQARLQFGGSLTVPPVVQVNGSIVGVTPDPDAPDFFIYATDGLTVDAGNYITIEFSGIPAGLDTAFAFGFDPGPFVTEGTQLEFTDDTDLRYFQADDVVQGNADTPNGTAIGLDCVWTDRPEGFRTDLPDKGPESAIDGNLTTNCALYYPAANANTYLYLDVTKWDTDFKGQIEVYNPFTDSGLYKWRVQYTDGTESANTAAGGSWFAVNPGNTTKTVKYVIAASPDNYDPYITAVRYASGPNKDTMLIAADLLSPAVPAKPITSVISTDPDNNKMVVSGGEWGAGGDTEVTGPLKRGNGTIESISGTAVVISPFTDNAFVEGQWLTKTAPIQDYPKSEAIASIAGNTITFDGPAGLLNFANGDAVTMCDADGNPASVTYESSQIIDVENNGGEIVGTTLPDNTLNDYTAWLASKGVTAITGCWLSNTSGTGGYTAAIYSLNINGSYLSSYSLRAEEIEGTPLTDNPVYGWQAWLDGISFPVQGDIEFYSCKFDIPVNVDGLTVEARVYVYARNGLAGGIYDQNGNPVAFAGTYNFPDSIVLTFEDGTNLDKFPVGTVVQSDPTAIYCVPQQYYYDPPANPLPATTGVWKVLPSFTITINSQSSQAGLWASNSPTSEWVRVGSFASYHINSPVTIDYDFAMAVFGAATLFTYKYWLITTEQLYSGTVTTDCSLAGVEVTDDSDIGNNKLTVDGGEWGGYNTSQNWTTNIVSTLNSDPSRALDKAFDGNSSTKFEPSNAGRLTFNIPALQGVTSGSIGLACSQYSGQLTLTINADTDNIVINTSTFPDSSGGDPGLNVPLAVTSLQTIDVDYVLGASVQFWGFYLNGQQLVDGPWDQSQVWSNYVPANADPNPLNLFNGVTGIGTSYNVNNAGVILEPDVFNPGAAGVSVPVTSSIGYVAYNVSSSTTKMTAVISGETFQASLTIPQGTNGVYIQINVGYGIAAGNLESLGSNTGGNAAISSIYVDGVQLVDPGIGGDTEVSVTNSGTGTVDTVDAPNNQITLSANNDQWLEDYYMKGPLKNLVEKKAYLQFNAQGIVTTLLPYDPGPVQMNNITTPVLTFPATFLTGQTPDAELPLPTYLQTIVSAGNALGYSPEKSSNILYPTTSLYQIPVNSRRIATEEFKEFCKMVCSHEYRAAEFRVEQAVINMENLKQKASNYTEANS